MDRNKNWCRMRSADGSPILLSSITRSLPKSRDAEQHALPRNQRSMITKSSYCSCLREPWIEGVLHIPCLNQMRVTRSDIHTRFAIHSGIRKTHVGIVWGWERSLFEHSLAFDNPKKWCEEMKVNIVYISVYALHINFLPLYLCT